MNMLGTTGHFDVRDIISLIRKRIWLILIPLAIISSIALGGSYLLTPEYEAISIIQIDPQVRLINDVQMLLGQQGTYRRQSSFDRRNEKTDG